MRLGHAALLVVFSVACDGEAARFRAVSDEAHREVGGEVVSTVNGMPIFLTQVRKYSLQTGLPPEEVLHRLQDRLVLAAEARRRGFASVIDDDPVVRQAVVQALLARSVEAIVVPEDELRADYERQRDRFRPPEKRASIHVLAKCPQGASPEQQRAARAFAQRAIALLSETGDLAAVRERVSSWDKGGLDVLVEELPAVPKDGPFVADFMEALFGLPAPGTVPVPVRTPFGYHAIRLTEILPGHVRPYDEVRGVLMDEARVALRRRELASLLTSEAHVVPIRRDETAIGMLGQIVP